MKFVFWTAGILLIPLLGGAIFYFSLYLGTGEDSARNRAVALWRWAVVVMLGSFNIWIFTRVFKGIWDLMH